MTQAGDAVNNRTYIRVELGSIIVECFHGFFKFMMSFFYHLHCKMLVKVFNSDYVNLKSHF